MPTIKRCKRLFVKPYKVGPRDWRVVSTIYQPPSKGRVGSGIIWASPFKTREAARSAIRTFYQTGLEP